MWGYVLHRLLLMVPGLLLVTMVSFTLIQVAPGDPATAYAGLNADPEYLARLREELGLNDPLPVQYLAWLQNALTGEFGTSFSSDQPVSEMLLEHLPRTLELGLISLAVSGVLGIAMGTLSALRNGRLTDFAATALALGLISVPTFVLAFVLILLCSVTWGWLPPGGYVPFSEDPVQHVRRLILPAIVLGAASLAALMRYTRASVLDALGEDYIRTARAKGISERWVVVRHGLRNALLPVVTILGLQVGAILEGSFIVETIFSWPGFGRLTVDGIQGRDYPVVQACVLVGAVFYMVTVLATDLLYARLDPRISYSRRAGRRT